MHKVVITNKGGKSTIKVTGLKGPACLAATREAEQALGEEGQRTKTSEYNEKETTKEQTH